MSQLSMRSRYYGEVSGMRVAFQDNDSALVEVLCKQLQSSYDSQGQQAGGLQCGCYHSHVPEKLPIFMVTLFLVETVNTQFHCLCALLFENYE